MPEVLSQNADRRLPAAILPAIALAGFAAWARHGFVESESLAPLCLEAGAPWWCLLRDAIETAGRHPALSGIALAAALLGVRWRRCGDLAMAAGGVALAFGHLGLGGPAIVLGLLAAVRQQR